MSADLFAEFGSFNSASPQSNPTIQPQTQPKPTSTSTSTSTQDPFAFLFSPVSQTTSPAPFQQPPQQWSAVQSQQNANNTWGGGLGFTSKKENAQQQTQSQTDDEEGWGDFEEAPPLTAAKAALPAMEAKPAPNPPVRNRVHRAPTLALMSNSLVELEGPTTPQPWQDRPSWETSTPAKSPAFTPKARVPSVSKPRNSNADVLFDADDFDGMPVEEQDDDDDFGDFETGDMKQEATRPTGAPQNAMADLLSLDFGAPSVPPQSTSLSMAASTSTRKPPPSQLLSTLDLNASSSSSLSPTSLYPQAPRSSSFSDRNPFPGLAVTTPVSGTFPRDVKADDDKETSPSPITAWPEAKSATDNDDWDAFADFPPDAASATPGAPSATSLSWDWDAVDTPQPAPIRRASKNSQPKTSSVEVIGPPPTNVPPPSILLSILSDLLAEADTKLYKPTANQTPAVKSRIYADPATLNYLKGYLALATVTARILAGRKVRWNRDKFLSQGMSVSAAGGKRGMKLAGIDKAQSAREDREAADVVGIWRDHVGKLRSAVAAANIGLQKQPVKLEPLTVPEINDHMAFKTAKLVPNAPHACVVCGLKRDERVKGVDFVVEDSFGEWWVDHWGHRLCRNFWLGNEKNLRSR